RMCSWIAHATPSSSTEGRRAVRKTRPVARRYTVPGLSMRVQQLLRERDDARGLEAELLLERFQRRRRAERAHADDAARAADVPLPPERGGLLDRDARRHAGRQHAVPIL